jgi:hypothetical protein
LLLQWTTSFVSGFGSQEMGGKAESGLRPPAMKSLS